MIQDLTLKQYHEEMTDYVSSSNLKQLLVSPKWMKYCIDNPEIQQIGLEANLKGSAYHAMLESLTNSGNTSAFKDKVAVFDPPVNPKTERPYGYETKAFTDAYNWFVADNPDKEVFSQTEIDLAETMVGQLTDGSDHLSKDINYLIKHGKAEQSHLVEYEGLKFKFRPDLETRTKIVDWKTCGFEVPKSENFAKQIVKFGYHISGAFYQFFDFIETGFWRSFYWVAQEKEPPYDFNIIDASNWTWSIHKAENAGSVYIPNEKAQYVAETDKQIAIPGVGAILFLQLLQQYIHCKNNDEWAGYSVFTKPDHFQRRITVSEVPVWEKTKNYIFYN